MRFFPGMALFVALFGCNHKASNEIDDMEKQEKAEFVSEIDAAMDARTDEHSDKIVNNDGDDWTLVDSRLDETGDDFFEISDGSIELSVEDGKAEEEVLGGELDDTVDEYFHFDDEQVSGNESEYEYMDVGENFKKAIEWMDWSYLRGRFYRYAPTVIRVGNQRYIFVCGNAVSGDITDHIVMRTDTWDGAKWVVGSESVVVWPGTEGTWDNRHVCDPSVIKGEFEYRKPGDDKTQVYAFAMFYTGLDKEEAEGGRNQIGWAVAKSLSGPWYKVVGNGPLVRASEWWGVGQPSATSIDGKGRVLLFYTRGDSSGTRTLRQEFDLSKANIPIAKGELEIPLAGLTDKYGNQDDTNNGGDFIYDPREDDFWLVRNGHPYPVDDCPTWVSDYVQVARTNGQDVWSGTGRWTVATDITAGFMGKHRVFDSCFVRNVFGGPLQDEGLVIMVSTNDACSDWLWSYRVHGVILSGFE